MRWNCANPSYKSCIHLKKILQSVAYTTFNTVAAINIMKKPAMKKSYVGQTSDFITQANKIASYCYQFLSMKTNKSS